MVSTVFFDVNETLSDLGTLESAFVKVGAPGQLATTWFSATLRDGFALDLTKGALPYQDVAAEVLAGLLRHVTTLSCSPEDAIEVVMQAFSELPVHADVVPGIAALAAAGHRLVCLSNGSVRNTRGLLDRAGILDLFALTLSVDDAGVWKPDRRAYEYGLAKAGAVVSDSALVAVHPWDLHGARQAGLTTVFLDRTGAPWPRVFSRPDFQVTALMDVHLP